MDALRIMGVTTPAERLPRGGVGALWVFFASPPETAKQYDNAAKALTERDALAQMLGDDTLTVRQIALVGNVVISRGEFGDEHRINWAAPEWQP
jgi:hypothetical protein